MMGSTKIGLIHCRRLILALGMGLLLAGCQIIPQVDPPYSPPPPSQPTGQQGTTGDRRTPPPIERDRPTPLPQDPVDSARHRVALLVPTSGDNGRVG